MDHHTCHKRALTPEVGETMKKENPIQWFEKKFCKNCQDKPCQVSGGGVFKESWERKLFCILSLNVMLEFDRIEVKRMIKHE